MRAMFYLGFTAFVAGCLCEGDDGAFASSMAPRDFVEHGEEGEERKWSDKYATVQGRFPGVGGQALWDLIVKIYLIPMTGHMMPFGVDGKRIVHRHPENSREHKQIEGNTRSSS